MATDAINPAVPGPSDPSDANAPRRPAGGLIASLLAPVAPARPTFDLTTPTGAEGATDAAVTGVSSAAFHGTDEAAQQDSKTAATNAQKKGIWRAWMLAGAARWGRGGGTQNKRLDMKRAKAQAQQVKETRTVSINRTPAPLRGSSSGNSGGGKSLGSKGNSGGAVKGPQNSNGKAHQGPAGRSGNGAGTGPGGSGGRGPSGGRTTNGPAGRDRNASPKSPKTDAGSGRTPKQEKTSLTKGGTTNSPKGSTGGGSAGGKKGAPGPAGSPGKSGGAGTSGSGGSGKGSGSTFTTDGKGGKALAPKDNASGKDTKQSPPQNGKQTTSNDAKDSKGAPGTTPAKTDDKTKVNLRKLNLRKGKTSTEGAADQKTSQANGKRFSTRESRETGYRDGTRAAKVAAHTKAYRDGVKDGWTDTTTAADREKTRLDQAHQARIKARDEEKPVTGTQSSADYHEPQPIGVKEVTATHVVLGDGAAKDSVTRGEVRTLKSFERRLTAKSDSMTKVAEMTKGMQAHAEEQAKKATKLLEDAKAVKGGEKLAGTLARMEEAARIQADKAKEIHKRAVRAAEACAVVLANVETRYDGMYKAVVDSDETAPAELHFYKDQG